MEVPWHSWISDSDVDDSDIFSQCHQNSFDEEEFLREILHQPSLSSETESHSSTIQNNSISKLASSHKKPSSSSSPSTYILSFDNSTLIPAATQDANYRKHRDSAPFNPTHEQLDITGPTLSSHLPTKSGLKNHNSSLTDQPKANQRSKKARSSSEALDHIVAERNRRQHLREKFIALAATIPGLKKIDKASILSEAVKHMKQLQERVKELEQQSKKTSVDEETTSDCELMSSRDCYRLNEALPEVEARLLHKQIRIRIHCEKYPGIMLKILAHLQTLHFSIISNNVVPFGNSTLDITIIAEVGDKCNITVKELVKKLRLALLKSPRIQE